MKKADLAILAGGKGTRLSARSAGLPKPLVPIMGRPVLQHLVELARSHGFTDIALLVHYRHELIRDYFGDGDKFGVALRYIVEEEPRGTAGALHDALPELADDFLVVYGDTFADLNLRRLWQRHISTRADATLFLHPNDHPQDSDLMETDSTGAVTGVHPYPHAPGTDHANLVNAALYAMNAGAIRQLVPQDGRHDIARDIFPAMLKAGMNMQAYVSPEYIKDMGTPDRLDRVEADIRSGRVERLSGRQPRAAVFLDRDGTLNVEKGHISDPGMLELISGAGAAVQSLNKAGLLAIVVTNQPVIARGETTFAGMDRIHARLDSLLGKEGAYIDRLYFCPHHPDGGYAGEVAELKMPCRCRKPGTAMIDAAVEDLHIDRSASWMIGDSTSDIAAGKAAGLRTILVRTGAGGGDGRSDIPADHVATDIDAAVRYVIAHDTPARISRP